LMVAGVGGPRADQGVRPTLMEEKSCEKQ